MPHSTNVHAPLDDDEVEANNRWEMAASSVLDSMDGDHGRRPRRRVRPGMGCALATAVLVVGFVLFGHGLFRRSLSALTLRAAQRLEESLPGQLDPERRERVAGLLRHYVTAPVEDLSAGRFLQLTARLLEDDRITAQEVDELETFLQSHPREAVE